MVIYVLTILFPFPSFVADIAVTVCVPLPLVIVTVPSLLNVSVDKKLPSADKIFHLPKATSDRNSVDGLCSWIHCHKASSAITHQPNGYHDDCAHTDIPMVRQFVLPSNSLSSLRFKSAVLLTDTVGIYPLGISLNTLTYIAFPVGMLNVCQLRGIKTLPLFFGGSTPSLTTIYSIFCCEVLCK